MTTESFVARLTACVGQALTHHLAKGVPMENNLDLNIPIPQEWADKYLGRGHVITLRISSRGDVPKLLDSHTGSYERLS